jgi:hypothetical protein
LKMHFWGLVLVVSWGEQPREEKWTILFMDRIRGLPAAIVALRGRSLRAMEIWQATPAGPHTELCEVRYQSPGSKIDFIRRFREQIWKYQPWYSQEH